MPAPLPLLIPGAAACLAYLNARFFLSYDCSTLSSVLLTEARIEKREKRDRLNIFYVLEENAQSRKLASQTFLWYQGQEWTYKETYELVLKYGIWLRASHGVMPKDIVAMDMMNSPSFIFVCLGMFSIGAIPALINYNLTGEALMSCVKLSTARLLIVDDEIKNAFTREMREQLGSNALVGDGEGGLRLVFMTPELEQQISDIERVRAPDGTRSGVKISDTAALIYTSGTTGLPKPAIVSWYKPMFMASFTGPFLNWQNRDRIYTSMPLYHTTGFIMALCAALNNGSSIALGHKFSPNTFWKEVRDSTATIIQYVGETCRYLLAAPPELDPVTGENLDKKHHVRIAFGNGLSPDIWTRFKDRFGIPAIAEIYGATESPFGLFHVSNNDFSKGAIGRTGNLLPLLFGRREAIVQVDWDTETPFRDPATGFCQTVGTGQPGELLLKLAADDIKEDFQGYFRNGDASESKILRNVFRDSDAWFRTGDVVRRDGEGRWFFVDRIGDTFRWKGENVSTTEVAQVLCGHPAVREANVYGVPLPGYDGKVGMAAIVLDRRDGRALQDVLAELGRFVQSRLPSYAAPVFVRLLGEEHEFRTGTHKLMKMGLVKDGIDPEKIAEASGAANGGDGVLFWLRDGVYRPFTNGGWTEVKAGRAKL